MKASIGGRLPAFPPGAAATRQFTQSRRRHHRQLAEHRFYHDLAAIKQHSLIHRRALVANLFPRHLRLQIERIGPESSAGVGKSRGADLQRTPIVTLVSGGLEIGEPVFLQQRSVRRIGGGRIFAGLRRTLNLPPRKLLGKDGRVPIRLPPGGEATLRQTQANQEPTRVTDLEARMDAPLGTKSLL